MLTCVAQRDLIEVRLQHAPCLRVNDPVRGWCVRPISDLVMIRGVKGYSWLYWQDGNRQLMAYTLKHYADMVSADQYIRVHQNCLVNRSFVEKVQLTHKGPQIELVTGDRIPVSRRRWILVKRVFINCTKQNFSSTGTFLYIKHTASLEAEHLTKPLL